MAKVIITEELQNRLENFLRANPSAELITTYLTFIEMKFHIQPVVCPKEKMIYQDADDAVHLLEKEDKIWREAEVKIGFSNLNVNEQTKKIYICPFTGKVFADNTHPNPQDAIYDWVSKCPENTERVGGLRVKRFFTSDDPEIIKSYASKVKYKEPIVKKAFSSVFSGKLFGSKEAVIRDFKDNYLHSISLSEVQNQNKFHIEGKFLDFIQKQLDEDKIGAFIEALADIDIFKAFVIHWLE